MSTGPILVKVLPVYASLTSKKRQKINLPYNKAGDSKARPGLSISAIGFDLGSSSAPSGDPHRTMVGFFSGAAGLKSTCDVRGHTEVLRY